MLKTDKRNRRNEIARVAIEEFAAHGFAGARVDRIAKAAGVNKQLIFYYYESKAGLYGSVMSDALEELYRAVSEATTPGGEQLRSVLGGFSKALAQQPHLLRLAVQDAGAEDRKLAESVIDAGVRRLADVISTGQGLGYFRDDADPTTMARHAVLLALGYLALLQEPALRPGTAQDAAWITSVGDLLMRVLAW